MTLTSKQSKVITIILRNNNILYRFSDRFDRQNTLMQGCTNLGREGPPGD
jgi:hypothetical protein